jgi:hypothetical protein
LAIPSTASSPSAVNHIIFPRQEEGNIYSVNWSLVEDGVTSTGLAFRNARTQQLQNKLKGVPLGTFSGSYVMQEAGDNIDHDDFQQLLSDSQISLSTTPEFFVEDGFVGAHRDCRTGVRLITADAGSVSLLRKMLVCLFGLPKLSLFYFELFQYRSQQLFLK